MMTLFDSIDDDDFDGEFGQDDDEMPMIKTMFKVVEAVVATPKAHKEPPKMNNSMASPRGLKKTVTMANKASPRATGVAAANKRNTMAVNTAAKPNLTTDQIMSPSKGGRRKTIVLDNGQKKIVREEEEIEQPGESARYKTRQNIKKNKVSDVFGDFFGFGSNPAGCMAKGAAPVNFKQEKDKFLNLLKE